MRIRVQARQLQDLLLHRGCEVEKLNRPDGEHVLDFLVFKSRGAQGINKFSIAQRGEGGKAIRLITCRREDGVRDPAPPTPLLGPPIFRMTEIRHLSRDVTGVQSKTVDLRQCLILPYPLLGDSTQEDLKKTQQAPKQAKIGDCALTP